MAVLNSTHDYYRQELYHDSTPGYAWALPDSRWDQTEALTEAVHVHCFTVCRIFVRSAACD